METCLLGYEHAATVIEIAAWANDLIGKEVPGYPAYRVVKVIQFQILPGQSGYDAMILVDVVEKPVESDHVAIRKEDIMEIEELTSSIPEPLLGETTLGE
jgi:hypothetical protein